MSTLHHDDWILRRIYDTQREIAQVRMTSYEVNEYPLLAKLLDERYDQLQAEFAKYENICKHRKK